MLLTEVRNTARISALATEGSAHTEKEEARMSLFTDGVILHRASLVAQLVKNPPALRETWIQSLDQEYPLEKGMATHSGILPGESQRQRSLAGYSS